MMEPSSDLVLYHGLASTCSKKVRLCLYEKRLPFASRLLDLQKFEQHDPEYLKLNPNGVVPTLVHQDRPIVESSIIIEYLDDCFPEPSLKPETPYGRSSMRLWTKFSDDVAYKAVYAPTWHALRHRAAEGLSESKLGETLEKVPSKERRERWQRMAQGGYSDAELEAAYNQMRECLQRAEQALAKTPWLAGQNYSLADIAMVPFIDRIKNLRPEFMDEQEYPSLYAWYQRMRARPAFEQAFNFKDDPRAKELPNM
jgi:glutathione S-transferase